MQNSLLRILRKFFSTLEDFTSIENRYRELRGLPSNLCAQSGDWEKGRKVVPDLEESSMPASGM
jgi:hypothetical protein